MKNADTWNTYRGRRYSRVLAALIDTPFGPAHIECPHSLREYTEVEAVFQCLDGSQVKAKVLHCEECDCYAIPDSIPECPPAPDDDEAKQ